MNSWIKTQEEKWKELGKIRETRLSESMWLTVLCLLVPITGSAYLFQVLFTILKWDVIESIAFSITLCVTILYGVNQWQSNMKEKGRSLSKVLTLTLTTESGIVIQDFAPLETIVPLTEYQVSNKTIYPYKLSFKDFPYFDELIIHAPCIIEQLNIDLTIPVLWKYLIIDTKSNLLNVGLLTKLTEDNQEIHVAPAGSYYDVKKLQAIEWRRSLEEKVIES